MIQYSCRISVDAVLFNISLLYTPPLELAKDLHSYALCHCFLIIHPRESNTKSQLPYNSQINIVFTSLDYPKNSIKWWQHIVSLCKKTTTTTKIVRTFWIQNIIHSTLWWFYCFCQLIFSMHKSNKNYMKSKNILPFQHQFVALRS